jgi:hypothetical protein
MERVARDLPHLQDARQLEAYLDGLVKEATAQGQASALQIEPGIQAIGRFRRELGDEGARKRARRFSQSMLAISHEEKPRHEETGR